MPSKPVLDREDAPVIAAIGCLMVALEGFIITTIAAVAVGVRLWEWII